MRFTYRCEGVHGERSLRSIDARKMIGFEWCSRRGVECVCGLARRMTHLLYVAAAGVRSAAEKSKKRQRAESSGTQTLLPPRSPWVVFTITKTPSPHRERIFDTRTDWRGEWFLLLFSWGVIMVNRRRGFYSEMQFTRRNASAIINCIYMLWWVVCVIHTWGDFLWRLSFSDRRCTSPMKPPSATTEIISRDLQKRVAKQSFLVLSCILFEQPQ